MRMRLYIFSDTKGFFVRSSCEDKMGIKGYYVHIALKVHRKTAENVN
jgi:hypothetical protein